MANARDRILTRLRAAASRSGDSAAVRAQRDEAYRALPRSYSVAATHSGAELKDLFLDRLRHYEAHAICCASADVRSAVDQLVRERGRSRFVVPRSFPPEFIPDSVTVVRETPGSAAALEQAEGVLTRCQVAIAWTGTLALVHTADEGSRAATLLPDYLLCVVHQTQLVDTVPEAIGYLAAVKHAPLTLVSGPSASVDIEMTRVRGLHGPRHLDVVLIAE